MTTPAQLRAKAKIAAKELDELKEAVVAYFKAIKVFDNTQATEPFGCVIHNPEWFKASGAVRDTRATLEDLL